VPVLENIRTLCSEKRPALGHKILTAIAIDYMFDNWGKLLIYTRDGIVNISNNPAEQRVRPFAVGRMPALRQEQKPLALSTAYWRLLI
jgi:hypothetical protein